MKAWLDAHPSDAAAFTFSRHHYKILLTIREDFLAELEGLRGRLSAVALNRYRLRPMNGSAALLVAHQAPHLIDAEVAERGGALRWRRPAGRGAVRARSGAGAAQCRLP